MKKKIGLLTVLCFFFSQTLSFGAVTIQDLRLPKNFFPEKSSFPTDDCLPCAGSFPEGDGTAFR